MTRWLPKFRILHFAFCIFSLSAHGAATSETPAGWPAARYEPLINSSMFALATPIAPVATPGFASSLYLTGLAKVGDRDFVTIAYRDQQSRFSLYGGESSPDGVTLVSVEWSDLAGKSKVTVKKGSEFGTLTFDEATITKPAQVTPQPPPMPQVGQAGQPRPRPVVPLRVNQPMQQTMPQRIPIIPPPATNQSQAPVIVPPAMPAQASDPRRRVRIINSAPQ